MTRLLNPGTIARLTAPITLRRRKYRLNRRALRRVCPNLSRSHARHLARELAVAMVQQHITTLDRALMFIAQTAHESLQYQFRQEIWGPTQAQLGYEGRKDLGNIQPGDGKRFMGRTYIQITGRANYANVSTALGVDFLTDSSKLAEPEFAAKGAAWWWREHDCNQLADSGDFIAVTRRINGGTNGLADRQALYGRAKRRINRRGLVPKRRIRI